MTVVSVDSHSLERRVRDEQIAAEPQMVSPDAPPDATPSPMETHRGHLAHPLAIAGIVENGLVRPLDSGVQLPEHSRVIIVASEAT